MDVELDAIFPQTPRPPDWSGARRPARARRAPRPEAARRAPAAPRAGCRAVPARGQDSPLCAPRDPAEFGRLAAEVAAHAGPAVEYWQILNEPDARWAFKGDAQDYARMLAASHDAIAERVPAARIVLGGLERPGERRWLDAMLATPGADAARKFDVAAAHLRLRQGEQLADLSRSLTAFRALTVRGGLRRPDLGHRARLPGRPRLPVRPAYGGGDAGQAAFYRESLPLLAGGRRRAGLRDPARQPVRRVPQRGARAHRRPAGAPRRRAGRRSTPCAAWPSAGHVLIADDARQREHERLSVALAAAARRSRSAGREPGRGAAGGRRGSGTPWLPGAWSAAARRDRRR